MLLKLDEKVQNLNHKSKFGKKVFVLYKAPTNILLFLVGVPLKTTVILSSFQIF